MVRTVAFRLEGRAPGCGGTASGLRLALDPLPRGEWLRIVYAANLYADPVRPLIRFLRPGGAEEAPMPGPVLGRGIWFGRVPPDATGIELDPGAVPFRVEAVSVASTAAVLACCLVQRPGRLVTALSFFARGNQRRFRDTLRGVLATMPLDQWEAYAAPRRRGIETDIDRPFGTGEVPPIRLVVAVPDGGAAAAVTTVASLIAQEHRDWRALLVGEEAPATDDPRVARTTWPSGAPAPAVLGGFLGNGTVALGLLDAGDRLLPGALALLADRLAARPGARLVYADEELPTPGGVAPRLKPGWSPDRALATGYVGRPALHVVTGGLPVEANSSATLEQALVLDAALAAPAGSVHHLARVLLRRGAPEARPGGAKLAAALARADHAAAVRSGGVGLDLVWPLPAPPPLVSVVVPSRDRLDLVERCVRGVLEETDYPTLELVLVDNDSRDPAVLRLYERLSADPRVRIMSWAGPFDFASMVNDGVAAARGSVVVLLNNDTAVLHPDWLTEMVRQAVRPEVGAVGAKLLYANGTLQHAGVVVGLGGRAGHVLRRRPADTPGHLDRLMTAHEVSAVTAACLAVERAKYLAVGGLDAAAFPIDFNDVDFCLRLAARGWKTVWTPRATLSHLESISRGPAVGAERARFEAEGARFSARWDATIRDDPFYHPALSATTFGEDLE